MAPMEDLVVCVELEDVGGSPGALVRAWSAEAYMGWSREGVVDSRGVFCVGVWLGLVGGVFGGGGRCSTNREDRARR